MDDDVLRILVSTDNHLGVWEKDEVRKDDSFVTFEEVLEIAARNHADFVLLGGDLFHDNKPSRHTVVRAMEILTRHCMGDRPVRFQVLSDQAQNFTTGRINYEDPHYNVGLPVLTIHGNHDDPAGAENLSAVDIVSTARLVNYFGKAAIEGQGTGKLRIAPVLLQKGDTQVALYGLGNLRDERLCRLFATPGHVEWIRPSEDKESWFNLFVLHQNRVAHTQNAKNCLREGALAKFLDLVVWGHEHECLADPWESAGGSFSVMQPGSSVATALSEGEAKRKHCVMVEILGHQWRTVKHPLQSVRPFQFASVVLAEQMELDPEKPEGVAEFLERKVQEMIDQAHRERDEKAPELPLIRLRVDYSGFSTINTQRFGQRFVGKVANPHDMVLWQKAPQRRQKEAAAAGVGPSTLIRPEALDESRIEDLIGQHLQHNLEILPEQLLTEALHEFVEKDNKESWREAVQRALTETQTTTLHDKRATQIEQDEDLVNVIKDVNQRRKEAAVTSQTQRGASQAPSAAQQPQQQRQLQQLQQGSIANGLSHMQLADDDLMEDGPAPSNMAPPAARKPPRAPAAAPTRRATGTAAARGKAQPAASAAGGTRQSPLNFGPTQSRGTQRGTQLGETSGSAVGTPAGRKATSRTAATKAQQKLKATFRNAPAEDEAEDDDEVQMVDLTQEAASDGISDSDDGLELEAEELEAVAPPSATRKRGRAAAPAPSAAGGRRRGAAAAAPSQHTGGTSFVVSDDEDEVLAAPVGRRRLGGAGMLAPAGRSQLGTGSQQGTRGWGTLKD